MICLMTTVNSSDMKKLVQSLLIAFAFVASPVFAVELDQAKNDGLIGERADGYLGLVETGASAPVVALVQQVNTKRKAEYERIAAKNNLSLDQVQALAGKKTIERTRQGHWVLLNGGWQRK